MLPVRRALSGAARQQHRIRPSSSVNKRLSTLRYNFEPHAAAPSPAAEPGLRLPGLLSSSASSSSGQRSFRVLPHVVGPFLFGSVAWSTYYFYNHCNEELVAGTAAQEDVRNQIWGLFKLYQYLELTTDGPRFDLSELASLIDWRAAISLAPTQSAMGLVYWAWSTLLHGVDNTVAFFPAMDVKAKLIRLGLLDNLEEALDSPDGTVRMCAAYVVSRLVRNTQVARVVAERPKIVHALLDLCSEEVVMSSTGRFMGFLHSESNTSAEVFITLLDTLNHVLDATVNKDVFLIGGHGTVPMSVNARSLLDEVDRELVLKMATVLKQLESYNEQVQSAHSVFSDHHMVLYRRFFPRQMDDQVRRRMREVEATIARFLGEVSKDASSCERLMLDRHVLLGLAPLAVSEVRNTSAFVHAVGAVHNILDRVVKHRLANARNPEEDDADMSQASLLVDSRWNRSALLDVNEVVAERDDGVVGKPFTKLTSVYAMRCYTSSMACLIAGGVYGLLRTPAHRLLDPLMVYSINGLGAVALNMLYGTYGLRNWLKGRTYIEDETAHVAWTLSQVAVDATVLSSLIRRHPYALLPMVLVNWLGHNSYPGTGLKRCDGLDCALSLN